VRLLLDTHVLIWMPTGDSRMSESARRAIEQPDAELFVSAVCAFELADLQVRRRIAMTEPISAVADLLGLAVIDFPAESWAVAASLPKLHQDPVDRMMIAHAIVADFTLVTKDRTVRRYPVETLW
jgi:PIN domain nuclease of toxin-antitoxin system